MCFTFTSKYVIFKPMRLESTLKSTLIILLINILNIIVNFLTRKLFIDNIGIVFLGISSVFTNILTLLSLSELGIHSAITFQLYRPIKENKLGQVKYLVKLFDAFYKKVAVAVLALGLVILLILPVIIHDAELFTSIIRFYFLIQLSTTLASYLFASRRTLLFVYQKQYLAAVYDAIINIIFTILRIISIVIYKNFTMYLVVNGLQILSSNLFIYYKTRKHFPFLHDNSVRLEPFSVNIRKNLINTSLSSVANFIYSSTDNIVISIFIGIKSVGFLSNYKLIPYIIIEILTNIFKPVQASIGDLVHEHDSKATQIETFEMYSYIRFLFAHFVSIMCLVLMDPFIELWFGKQYLMSPIIVVLIVVDLYLFIYQGSLNDFIQTYGLFKDDRKLMIRGAIINLVTSLLLVRLVGIEGVLIGTIITQVYYWIARTSLVHSKAFSITKRKYLLRSVVFFAISIISSILLYSLISRFYQTGFLFFLFASTVSGILTVSTALVFTSKSKDFKILKQTYLPIILKSIHR